VRVTSDGRLTDETVREDVAVVLIVPLDEVRAGMKLAAPVQNPEAPDQVLLKTGYMLEDSVVRRLRAIGIQAVLVEYPALDDLDKHLAAHLSPARQKVYQIIKQSIGQSEAATKPAVPYADYYSATRDLVTTLMSQGQHPLYMDQMTRLGSDAVGHAASVAHLSLLLGMKLETYLISERKRLDAGRAKDVVNLGVAGMLHDVGKVKLPPALRQHSQVGLAADHPERRQWEEHARLGYDMVHDEVEPTAASAILHHHQRFDGTGFPTPVHTDGTRSPLDGRRIHIFARIVAAANLYDRLATSRAGTRVSNLEVLHLMRAAHGAWLDPVVLKTLHEVVPPFPPGSRVALSDGTHAVVTKVEPGDPFNPVCRRLLEDNWTLEDGPLNLKRPDAPTIVAVGTTPVASFLPTADAANKLLAAT